MNHNGKKCVLGVWIGRGRSIGTEKWVEERKYVELWLSEKGKGWGRGGRVVLAILTSQVRVPSLMTLSQT